MQSPAHSIVDPIPARHISEIELEPRIILIYDVSVIVDGQKRELTMMADGAVLEIEQ